MSAFIYDKKSDLDEDKYEYIYDQYINLMFHIAYDILRNREDAEDAVIDALLKVSQNISKFEDPLCPRSKHLIVIITEQRAIDLYRKRNKQETLSWEDWMDGGDTAVYSESKEESIIISDAIVKLPLAYRGVILLKFSDGYSTKEIARMLGYSVSKVEKLISRGKKKLRYILREEGIEV